MARQLTLTDCNFLGPRAEERKRNAQENKRKYEAKRQRSFLDKWCVDFPGLIYKEEENKMFCGVCCRHPSLADKTSSLFTGNNTFRIQSLQSHWASANHIMAQARDYQVRQAWQKEKKNKLERIWRKNKILKSS